MARQICRYSGNRVRLAWSGGFECGAVALLRGLCRGAEESSDLLPRDACGSCLRNGVEELLFAASSGDDGAAEEVLLDRDLDGIVGVEVLEALGELVGVVEDVLDRSRHEVHLTNLGLAGTA